MLESLKKLLQEGTYLGAHHDDEHSEIGILEAIYAKVEKAYPNSTPSRMKGYGNIQKHYDKKTIYTASTSLCSASNAIELRAWFEREFRTESGEILEAPRESYALVFIDDLHLSIPSRARPSANASSNCDGGGHNDGGPDPLLRREMAAEDLDDWEDSREVTNKVEGLLKGLVAHSRPFQVRIDLRTQSNTLSDRANNNTKKFPTGYNHRTMPQGSAHPPVLHKAFITDPTVSQRSLLVSALHSSKILYGTSIV